MVSNARLDFPDPERPVTTTSASRGISSEMFLRLWTRAPWIAIVVRAFDPVVGLGISSELVRRFANIHERELLHVDVALLRETRTGRNLADDPLVGQVLARGRHLMHVEVFPEMIVDLAAGSGLADLTQMLDQGCEQRLRPAGHEPIDAIQCRFHPRAC